MLQVLGVSGAVPATAAGRADQGRCRGPAAGTYRPGRSESAVHRREDRWLRRGRCRGQQRGATVLQPGRARVPLTVDRSAGGDVGRWRAGLELPAGGAALPRRGGAREMRGLLAPLLKLIWFLVVCGVCKEPPQSA